MKVLITGVAGLLGSRLANWIIDNHPEVEIVGIDDLSGGYRENINPENVHFPRTRLVSLENTMNKGGGSCYDLEEIRQIRKLCQKHGLSLHLDGARVFNASLFLPPAVCKARAHTKASAPIRSPHAFSGWPKTRQKTSAQTTARHGAHWLASRRASRHWLGQRQISCCAMACLDAGRRWR